MSTDTLTSIYEGRWTTFSYDRMPFEATIERDEHANPPWTNSDGYGIVSEWTSRKKRPGELLLAESGGSYCYYDFAGTCKLARKDGWGVVDAPEGSTKRQIAALAARGDYNYVRGWCRDEWYYVNVGVRRLCPCCGGEWMGGDDVEWIGGVESNNDSYMIHVALELADDLAYLAYRARGRPA